MYRGHQKKRVEERQVEPPFPRLLLNNVSCMRNAQQVLRHVNVSLHDGGALVLAGANGSGKTTFLRMLAGFSRPSAGEILWNGHDIQESAIFHQYKLQLNWVSLKDAINDKFTVLNNVEWFELLEDKQGKARPALELMGLGRLANEKPRMLSMGQRKRLQLARLLAIDRPIWLLDEPSVALDDEGVKLLEYIIAEHRKHGGIVIVATHLPIEIEDSMVLRLPPRSLAYGTKDWNSGDPSLFVWPLLSKYSYDPTLFGVVLQSLWTKKNAKGQIVVSYNRFILLSPNLTQFYRNDMIITSIPFVCSIESKEIHLLASPDGGFAKLNCDGAFTSSHQKAAAGCIRRDHLGQFLVALSTLGSCIVLKAELWGIYEGLKEDFGGGTRPNESLALTLYTIVSEACSSLLQIGAPLSFVSNLRCSGLHS
ncbi:ABC transporter I family member 1, partial [Mucuna pruriens]